LEDGGKEEKQRVKHGDTRIKAIKEISQ